MEKRLSKRIDRIEKRLDIDRDDEIVEFPVGDGDVVRLRNRELKEILDEIGASCNKGLPGEMSHENIVQENRQN